ncbi:MAG: HWE histidine kinase domain-containing protein [Microvirga sp.]
MSGITRSPSAEGRTPQWPPAESETASLIRRIDWSATPLGTVGTWPQSLRTVVNLIVSSMVPMGVLWGPDGIQLYNDLYIPLLGSRHPAAFGQPVRAIWPDVWHRVEGIFEQVRSGEGMILRDHPWIPVEGGMTEPPTFSTAVSPLRDDGGAVVGLHAITIETTERVRITRAKERADDTIRRNEARFRAVVELVPNLLWSSEPDGRVNWFNERYLSYTGQTLPQALERGWMDAVHPDDRAASVRVYGAAFAAGHAVDVEERIRSGTDGSFRWFLCRAEALREDGNVVQWFGSATDIHDLRRAREHQRLLTAELQHRVRNTLAVVRSIARRTVAASTDLDDFAMHFDGRLGAFSRTQAMVTRDPSSGIDLEYIVADELRAHGGREGDRIHIHGPHIRLRPSAAETIGLAIHELATNAVKYGALSCPEGRIRIRWSIRGAMGKQRLRLTWIESGQDLDPNEPTRRGFGFDLLERGLSYELQADVCLTVERTGLHFRVELPLTNRVLADDRL